MEPAGPGSLSSEIGMAGSVWRYGFTMQMETKREFKLEIYFYLSPFLGLMWRRAMIE